MEIGGRHQHVLIVFDEDRLEAANELREEGVRDVGNDETVGTAATVLQRRGASVGNELELTDDLAHPFCGLRVDQVGFIDYAGDGCARNPCSLRYVPHVHRFQTPAG